MTRYHRWCFAVLAVATLGLGCSDADDMPAGSEQGAASASGSGALPPPSTNEPDAAQPGVEPLDASSAGVTPDASTGEEADAEEWTLLLEESWTLEPGGEVPQWCADMVLSEDVYVTAIRPVHPPGTHHTTLSATEMQTACSSAAVFQNGIIYAAGVGTETLRMPKGVALKLPAGHVLHLGLHLYNVSDQELSGVSGIEVIRADPDEVEHEAELMLAGPLQLTIPPGEHTITNNCSITEDQTVFALFPHMHQMGRHLKTIATVGGQPMVLHDGAYDFEEQYHLPIGPLDLRVGDAITTECTYQNQTDRTVTFGESSDTEMCFSILFRYPATGNTLCGRSF